MVKLNSVIHGVLAAQAVVLREQSSDIHQMEDHLSAFVSTEFATTMDSVSSVLLDPELGDKTNIDEVVKTASNQMDLKSAVTLMEKKSLPDDVSNLMQNVRSNTYSDFSEESLAKARRVLNELVEKAWIELDDKIFKCKGFQEMNRENYGQVTRDIMRLNEQLADLARVESESIEGISQKDTEINDAEALLEKETGLYNSEKRENEAELTIRKNDLDVFQFILEFTKCPDATSLSQTDMKVCEYRNGPHAGHKTLMFSDKSTATKYEKMLTPTTRSAIDRLLKSVEHSEASLLQQPAKATSTTSPQPKPRAPVKGAEDKEGCGEGGFNGLEPCVTCGPEPPDCALLHDKLSLMWGEFKDKVDELTMEMMKNDLDYEELKDNLNSQIRLLVGSKGRFQQLLGEARSNMAADRVEKKYKESQKGELDHAYSVYMQRCKKRIQWILSQDMCAIKTVRNAVLENSTDCPTAKIQDCSMDAWVPEPCSVSCDDSCDPNKPFKCGGWQTMRRKAIVAEDECGIKCPITVKAKRCGQYLCPIDCAMSAWSGWSKCTAECEGGLQSHTRSIRVKPRNGGESCNTVEESRPCHTETCDRDCRLAAWTQWTPCSVACGGGFMEQFRHVLIPTRGEGKCPKASSSFRYRKDTCNNQQCNGDEICIAQQDLVIALDSSGSVRQNGFKIIKEFVGVLLKRYMTEYYGEPAVKLGIVMFGNGIIMPDGKTVSPAINAHALSFNLDDVKKAVEGLPHKKGFTNMAQAFAMAEDMFVKGSRKEAQQSVMVITDGKPSFSFMTNEMVEQLDDKGIMRYFVVISETGIDEEQMKNMKAWASQPWETNLVHVTGGLMMLEADSELWAEKAITKFCPQAHSPMSEEYEIKIYGYMHVKDSGWCGDKDAILSKNIDDAEQCAALAAGAGAGSFLVGAYFRRGWCIAGTFKPDADTYKKWMEPASRVAPECPEVAGVGGKWKSSMLYDFYAMEPVGMKDDESSTTR